MLISPSIVDLTKGKYNAYTTVIAAAKGARMVTDEYVAQRERADRMIANKETDKSICALIGSEYRDEKSVKVAVRRLNEGDFEIVNAPRLDGTIEESETPDTADSSSDN
jgi:DNA-directed RNA polymerase subunit K/omega